MKKQSGYAAVLGLVYLLLIAACIGGWVANIVKFVNMDFAQVTGMLVVRGIGIFLAPLGAVLGYL